MTRKHLHPAQWGAIIALLCLHFFLRITNILAQDPYVDEGFHIMRGADAYDFEQHPARMAIGKLLLYFWLGIFESPPTEALLPARTAIAIFSLITAAGVFMIGRWLLNANTGLLALGLYAILPYAFFYERLAMADPFATGWMVLVIWRSLALVRKPTEINGILLGVCVGMATLAKLTMGLMPFIPVAAILIYGVRKFSWQEFWRLERTYLPPLIIAGFITLLLWLPVLIPAYIADQKGEPFNLLGQISYHQERGHTNNSYTESVLLEIYDFVNKDLFELAGAGLVLWYTAVLYAGWSKRKRQSSVPHIRNMLFIIAWVGTITVLTVIQANLPSSRYFMPVSVPLVVIIAYTITTLMSFSWPQKIAGAGLSIAVILWAVNFAIPFLDTALNDADAVELTEGTANFEEFKRGMLIAEDGVRAAATHINRENPDYVYAGWKTCSLLYHYVERPVQCLPFDSSQILGQIARWLKADVQLTDKTAYLVLADYGSGDVFVRFISSRGYTVEQLQPDPDLQVRPPYSNRAFAREEVCYVRENTFRPVCIFRIWYEES